MTTNTRSHNPTPMRVSILAALTALSVSLPLSGVNAEEKLQRGKDRVDIPASGPGLCLHNLF
jgi:hypothetical protein